ncbi:class I glutamine amidotransferase-like protein [Mycena belliarum]|uniref:Class I glutamine amidotransferase-like protein n=1 Tax=Mycena belliarum TaxID=1033014 RepID=A0AAD6TNR8_9AGAR|nr:class I glutamine amidotransferase-like protein [Mycena belliae]
MGAKDLLKLLLLSSGFVGLAAAADSPIPVNFGVIAFPGFEALDIFGPLDALNLLAYKYPMNLSIIAATMDPVGTTPRINPKNSNFSEFIVPTHTFENAPPLDFLLVPGGPGTRATNLNSTIDFVRDTYPSLQYFMTVCTGAGIAARAGVLDGKNATTNKRAFKETSAWGPKTNWITHARWVVDGNIWTTSGVSAGTDGLFGFMSQIYGEDVALNTANGMEYVRWTNASYDPFADLYDL